ncbi:MAG: hypothetical protein KGI49_01425 [Patescibacteria group bacterium]|nr:hypothetical protein [Patescibacteria group bacterium]
MSSATVNRRGYRQSERFSRKRLWRSAIGVSAGAISIASWLFVASGITYLPYFKISSIDIYGADPDIKDRILAAASGTLQGDYMGMFSESNEWIYPENRMVAAVASSSAMIRTVSISRAGRGTLSISVTEKRPSAIVCPELPDTSRDGSPQPAGQCYFADENGLIFEPADLDSYATSSYVTYYIPGSVGLSDGGSVIGSYATSTAEFVNLGSFVSGCRNAGIQAFAVLFKDGGQYEIYAGDPMVVIYADDQADLGKELSNLKAFWANMSSSSAGRTEKPLDYIDLRYGDNVFYRSSQ